MIDIDKKAEYTIGIYSYKNFVSLLEEEKLMVLEWRNNQSIRKFMYNRNEILLEDHLAFMDNLQDSEDKFYWLVMRSGLPIGVVNIVSIIPLLCKAELGYYMRPDKKNCGLGLDFVYHAFYFAFERGLKELYGSVDETNKNALILDEYLGCQFIINDKYEENGAVYVPWTFKKDSFMVDSVDKNNLRSYYLYIKQYNVKRL